MHAGRSMTLNLQTKSKFDHQELPLQKVSMDCPTCVSIPKAVNVVCSLNVFRLYIQPCLLQTLMSPKSTRENNVEPKFLAAKCISVARLIIRFMLFGLSRYMAFSVALVKVHFPYYSFFPILYFPFFCIYILFWR